MTSRSSWVGIFWAFVCSVICVAVAHAYMAGLWEMFGFRWTGTTHAIQVIGLAGVGGLIFHVLATKWGRQ